MTEFKYGMKLRGFAPMCQPKDGLTRHEEDKSGEYHDILYYDRPLIISEIREFELVPMFTYQELRDYEQEQFNALPIFWAFSQEQLDAELKKRNATLADIVQIKGMGGGLALKSDADIIYEWCNRKSPINDMMQIPEFAESAFLYEMRNHEYHINWQGDWDVCSCFGKCEYAEDKSGRDYLKEIGFSNAVIMAYARARQKFYTECEENDWW